MYSSQLFMIATCPLVIVSMVLRGLLEGTKALNVEH